MKRWFTLTALLAAPVVWGAAPVVEQSSNAPGLRTAPAAAETVSLRKQLADLTLEIEQLRTEMRELRGQLETQGHELESLKKTNREALADMDKRLRELERRSSPAGAGTAPGSGEPAAKTSATPPSADEQQAYDAAFALMKQGNYDKAGKSFREFIAKHPTSELAGNAQYWVGEAQYVVRNFKPALEEFTKVVEKYSASTKVPDALLKIGYCQQELGQSEKARATLQQVISRYPDTPVAKAAEQRLATIKVPESKPKAPAADTKGGATKKQ